MHKTMLALALALAASTSACAHQQMAHSASTDARNADLQALAARGVAISLVRYSNWQEVESEAFGGADPETSLFRIYSLAKPMTAAAAARLMGEGKLKPDANVRTYLPDFPEKGAAITPLMLATHRSGIRHYRSDEANARCADLDEAVAMFSGDALVGQPGEGEHYSSYGYVLLSAVVAAASKVGFDEAMRRLVFDPAGVGPALHEATNVLPPLAETEGEVGPIPGPGISCKFGAGGYLASAGDVARFARALFDGTLLPPAGQQLFLRGKKTYAAQGVGDGGTAMFAVQPQNGSVLVLLSNVSGPEIGPALKAAFDRRLTHWSAHGAETSLAPLVAPPKEKAMSSETGNAQAKKENRGSDNPNMKLQKQESRDPNKSNARDRTGRKGGDNEEAL